MTIYQHLFFLVCLLLIDLMTIRLIRKLLLDFLRSKKNKKTADRLYRSQPLKSRITLDYIYHLLKHDQRAFRQHHILYIFLLISAIPQYLIMAVLYWLQGDPAIFAVFLFGTIKIILYFFIRSYFDGNNVSIYRR